MIRILLIIVLSCIIGSPLYADTIQPQNGEVLNKKSIENILAKAESIGSLQYEAVSTISTTGFLETTMTGTSKIWEKMPYMRIESNAEGKNYDDDSASRCSLFL